MMKDPAGSIVVGVRPTNDANEGQVLTVSSSNSVEHAESTDGERHDAGADAACSSVAVSGVPSVELVAAADEVELRFSDEVVEQREVEVAGDGEHVGDADLS